MKLSAVTYREVGKYKEGSLYFTVHVPTDWGELAISNCQYFRGELQPPRSRDKGGNYWPVLHLTPQLKLAVLQLLKGQQLHKKHPGCGWGPEFFTEGSL